MKRRLLQLVFVNGLSDEDADEARNRGYLSHVLVETSSGDLFPVTFYDAVRLKQDVEDAANSNGFVAEPGMIVLREITKKAMESAARALCEEGYFAHAHR